MPPPTKSTTRWRGKGSREKREGRGIEVGHIFYFGTKYSEPMGLTVAGPDGKPVVPHMGSYGIGVSRLVGAIIEAVARRGRHHLAGQRRALEGRPAQPQERRCRTATRLCEEIYGQLGADPLYDDRDDRAGVKFADADLMGHPWQIVVGPRGAANGG